MAKALSISYQNIQAVYDFLDEQAFEINRESDITTIWRQFRNATTSEQEKQEAQWELEAFLFSFHGNTLFSFSYSNGATIGEIKQYPLLDEYQKEAFGYLQKRVVSAKSPLLLARYNHLLWKGIAGKTFIYASNAIANYIQCVDSYYLVLIKRDGPTKDQYFIGQWVENALEIGNETKKMLPELREMINRLLFKLPEITLHNKMGIVDDMLKYNRIFKPEHFDGVLRLYNEMINNVTASTDDFLLVNYYLPAAIKVAQKIQSDVKVWHEQVGLTYLRMAEKETEAARYWIKLNEYSDAIDAFRMAGDLVKKKEAEQLYAKLRPSVALEQVELPFDEKTKASRKAVQDEIQQKAKSLLKQHAYTIYTTIASAKLLPNRANVESITKTFDHGFLQTVKTITFDNNKNVSAKKDSEKEDFEFCRTYGLLLREQFLPYLHYIFVPGIKCGQLTYNNFIAFLVQHTWIGKTITVYDLGNQPEETNWTRLIAPAIVEYFVQIQAWGESKYYTPNFILCIDSLTLKIEGIFRNLCDKLNISTAIGKPLGMQEVLLNNILANDELRKHFSEADWLLFEYVFANKGGLNMRNNVAHAFYTENEYFPDMMHLLLAVLLKLAIIKIPD